jgi:hypothetical protein
MLGAFEAQGLKSGQGEEEMKERKKEGLKIAVWLLLLSPAEGTARNVC